MLRLNKKCCFLTCTRFNEETWNENIDYREKLKYDGCIYGVPCPISETIPQKAVLLVLEMNNTKPERIMGIGVIINRLIMKKKHNIYSNNNYNRYTYHNKIRIDRTKLQEDYNEDLELLEKMVFKGKDHMKRGQGITKIPNKKLLIYENVLTRFANDLITKYEITL